MCCFLFPKFQTEQWDDLWAVLCFLSRFIWFDSINVAGRRKTCATVTSADKCLLINNSHCSPTAQDQSSDAGRFDRFQKTKRDTAFVENTIGCCRANRFQPNSNDVCVGIFFLKGLSLYVQQ